MNHKIEILFGSRRRFLMQLAASSLAGIAFQRSAAAGEASGSPTMLGHRKIGNGPQGVLVLHEWLGDHANWEPLWPYIDGSRFTYIFADLRGYGWSQHMTGMYNADEAAADGLQIMDRYGFRRFHVVGHSMSGMIGQLFLVKAPGRVISLVAISPVPAAGFKADEKTMKALSAVIEDDAAARKAIAARGGDRYGDTWLNFKLGLARKAAAKAAMAGYLKMFTSTDFADAVRGNRTPVRAIVGKYDIPFYQEEAVRRNFEPLYPNFSLIVCEEAGHYAMLEAPVFVAANIEKFIASHS